MSEDIYQCQNCDFEAEYVLLPVADNLAERLGLGDIFTDVECPECGALCYPKKPNLEINRVLTISIAHVTEQDARELNDKTTPLVSYPTDPGPMILVDRDCGDPEGELSPALKAVVDFAQANDCQWVRLHQDGPVIAELPSYDW